MSASPFCAGGLNFLTRKPLPQKDIIIIIIIIIIITIIM